MSKMDAMASRDGLAKFLYSGIFDTVFNRLNERGNATTNSMKGGSGDGEGGEGRTIGVLDIFGFEIVQRNSFEQLVINYANESLQAVYNEFVFRQELTQYEEEGLDVSNITYTDNIGLLHLLDKKPKGIFWLLDQQGMRGGEAATDKAFLANVNQSNYGGGGGNAPLLGRWPLGVHSLLTQCEAIKYSVALWPSLPLDGHSRLPLLLPERLALLVLALSSHPHFTLRLTLRLASALCLLS